MEVTAADSVRSPGKEGPPCSGVTIATRGVEISQTVSLLKVLVMFPEPRPPALSRGRLDLTSESGSLTLIARCGEVWGQYGCQREVRLESK